MHQTYFLQSVRTAGVISAVWYFFYATLHPYDFHLIDTVNLIMHEAGHVIFMLFGQFLYVAGGSLFQLIVPGFCVVYFALRAEYLSSSVMILWLGESLNNVSVYAGDALARQLPLLGDDPESHDWFYLLDVTGTLTYTHTISGILHGVALSLLVLGTGLACWVLYLQITRERV
ncbi:MAG: hypothetical protein WAX38_02860 [Minisyncoccia bacterium]